MPDFRVASEFVRYCAKRLSSGSYEAKDSLIYVGTTTLCSWVGGGEGCHEAPGGVLVGTSGCTHWFGIVPSQWGSVLFIGESRTAVSLLTCTASAFHAGAQCFTFSHSPGSEVERVLSTTNVMGEWGGGGGGARKRGLHVWPLWTGSLKTGKGAQKSGWKAAQTEASTVCISK